MPSLRWRRVSSPPTTPVPASGHKREPVVPLTKDWHKANRIDEQIDYYRKGRARDEAFVERLWWVAFASALAAAAFGALGAVAQVIRPVDRRDDDDRRLDRRLRPHRPA